MFLVIDVYIFKQYWGNYGWEPLVYSLSVLVYLFSCFLMTFYQWFFDFFPHFFALTLKLNLNFLDRSKQFLKSALVLMNSFVVYFDQWTGAPHAIGWSKSFVFVFLMLKQLFPSISVKKCKKWKNKKKHVLKGGLPLKEESTSI